MIERLWSFKRLFKGPFYIVILFFKCHIGDEQEKSYIFIVMYFFLKLQSAD